MTDSYTIWKPEHDGHAPPNWREGMKWTDLSGGRIFNTGGFPKWETRKIYYVEPEALTVPDDDAAFDVAIWLKQGRANLDKLPEGVALPEPKDWATELWADMNTAAGFSSVRERINAGRMLSEQEKAAIALIRERVVLKGEG